MAGHRKTLTQMDHFRVQINTGRLDIRFWTGIMADSDWNIYFSTRDVGFDFIATISTDEGVVIRPVQVKGNYPTEDKNRSENNLNA
jgi:hypothetical protein